MNEQALDDAVTENAQNEYWLDRPVFVTGGTGLVGGVLIRRLLERGAEVTCLIRDWVPKSELARGALKKLWRMCSGLWVSGPASPNKPVMEGPMSLC
jgi:hypothetical protein